MDFKDKRAVLLDAIDKVKRGTFKATAIKVELEAQLNRDRAPRPTGDCSICDGEGDVECDSCYGDYESHDTCPVCDGNCRIAGSVERPEHDCDRCEGSGEVECEACEEGRIRCSYCEVQVPGVQHNWRSDACCQDYLFEQLAVIGLAEINDGANSPINNNFGKWRPKAPLVFGKFYNDHSVDSEFTFTLSLKNSEDILKLPEVIKVWNKFSEAIGQGSVVTGAGMHMAWLNDPKCFYSERQRPGDARYQQFKNFRRSMQLLLPAMYFLASADETSRPLRYRLPQVECGDFNSDSKYSAISYRNCALEFRAFNTCYDNPEAILDNVVVMKNCLRYWTKTYKPSGLERIVSEVDFGSDSDDTLKRFYCTTEHLDLLNAGLRKLKPAYLTIQEAKAQRKFDIDKKQLKKINDEHINQARLEYEEYEERFAWNMAVRRERYHADMLERILYNTDDLRTIDRGEAMGKIANEVEEIMVAETSGKKKLESYIKEKVDSITEKQRGKYKLSVREA